MRLFSFVPDKTDAFIKIHLLVQDAVNFQLLTLFSIVFFSGFAGLGYKMAWTRMLSVGLCHETLSVLHETLSALAVVAAFFCGMAIGAWILGRVGSDCKSETSAGRWYAGIETTIGCWSVVLLGLIPLGQSVGDPGDGGQAVSTAALEPLFSLPFCFAPSSDLRHLLRAGLFFLEERF